MPLENQHDLEAEIFGTARQARSLNFSLAAAQAERLAVHSALTAEQMDFPQDPLHPRVPLALHASAARLFELDEAVTLITDERRRLIGETNELILGTPVTITPAEGSKPGLFKESARTRSRGGYTERWRVRSLPRIRGTVSGLSPEGNFVILEPRKLSSAKINVGRLAARILDEDNLDEDIPVISVIPRKADIRDGPSMVDHFAYFLQSLKQDPDRSDR